MSQRRLPAAIYWRRRLLVLAAVIAVVWGVLQLTGGDDTEPRATPTTAPATRAPSAEPETKVNGLVNVALVSDSAPCDPEKIRITPTVRSGQTAKAPVEIGLVVSAATTKACTLTPDDADAIAVISANGTAIWDSTVCKVSPLTDPVAISPGWSTMTTVRWTGRGSGSTCSAKEGWATPGKYTVQIGTLGGEPGKTSFTLEAKPKPEPTRTTKTPKSTRTTTTPSPPKGTTKPADE